MLKFFIEVCVYLVDCYKDVRADYPSEIANESDDLDPLGFIIK